MPLTGAFKGRTKWPSIKDHIVMRRLGIRSEVIFLVDTGADHTMLSTTDIERLGIDVARLAPGPRLAGIGGQMRPFMEPATLAFREVETRIHIYRVNLLVASPRNMPRGLPSVLGRDILNRWHMNYRPTERRLEFDVVSADDSLDLDA